MTVHHADDWLTIHVGDCRAILAELPAESVNCVVTSPPYYGLRDYGTATWDGGDAECDHLSSNYDRGVLVDASGRTDGGGASAATADKRRTPMKAACFRCGARRIDSQLGLEPTPDAYIANLVAVFREVRRVLRKDGTVWLNLGDTYASAKGHAPMPAETLAGGTRGVGDDTSHRGRPAAEGSRLDARDFGMKGKDRMMIPARVAIALQADGWWLRDEIVWAKPNPMPSSVTDRTTPAHEMVYLLTRSARYAYDSDAIREDAVKTGTVAHLMGGSGERAGTRDGLRGLTWPTEAGRNKRSVWTVATQPYREAHFATFPEALIEPMILAGCPERVCVECGAPWERVVEYKHTPKNNGTTAANMAANGARGITSGNAATRPVSASVGVATPKTELGWRATCTHDAGTRPGVVLDPFGGSGTVGLVAERLGRRSVLIDLSADYAAQMVVRVAEGRASGRGPAVDMPVPPADDGLWAS